MKQLIRRLSRGKDSLSSQKVPLLRRDDRRQERVPEGHVPVYVGTEMERFVVPAGSLGGPAMLELLSWSATEYGFEQRGVLRIPCTVELFRRVLETTVASSGGGGRDGLDEMGIVHEGSAGYCRSLGGGLE